MICITDILGPTALLIGALLMFWMLKGRTRRNFPPGPSGFPLLGYVPFLGKNPGETLMKLKKKYGSLMSVQMGRDDWVVLNDFETINEGLVKQSERFSGRPTTYFFNILAEGIIMMDYGPTWKKHRKFGLMTLRGFGVGRKSMEENIREEANYLLENLQNVDASQTLKTKLTIAVSNVISRIVLGKRFDYEDKRFQTLLKVVINYFSDNSDGTLIGLITVAPFLRHLPGFRGAMQSFLRDFNELVDILKQIIDDHKNSFAEDDLRDFIDAFLKEMREKGRDNSSFNEQHLIHYIRDLFEAGAGTTSSTLFWSIFTLCHFPEIQEKLAEEVRNVIGENGTPTMNHRDQMPYTCAFIHEIMRLKTLVPIAFHKTNEDSVLGGYDIPKNTIVSPNLWAVHHDPETFPEPNKFKPERFLDENGKFVKSSHVIPFSVGPRYCLGEQLARMELFILLTSIVQKLKIASDPNAELPPYEDSGQSNGVTFEGPDFKVVFEKR